MVALGRGGIYHERGTPVAGHATDAPFERIAITDFACPVQGYIAHKKARALPLGLPYGPRHMIL